MWETWIKALKTVIRNRALPFHGLSSFSPATPGYLLGSLEWRGGGALVSLPTVIAKTSSCNVVPIGVRCAWLNHGVQGNGDAFIASLVAHPEAGGGVSRGWRRKTCVLSPGTGWMVTGQQVPRSGTVNELKMPHIIPSQETSINWPLFDFLILVVACITVLPDPKSQGSSYISFSLGSGLKLSFTGFCICTFLSVLTATVHIWVLWFWPRRLL